LKRITILSAALIIAALTAAVATSTASPSGGLPTLSIAMNGKRIVVSGTAPSGAAKIVSTTTNVPAGSPTLVRLEPGVTFGKAFAQVAAHHGDPNYLQGLASIVFSAEAPKGTSSAQTMLRPGNYEALDTTSDNPAKWPRTQFTVSAGTSPASLPKAQATVKSIDFAFRGPRTLHDGELVRFEDTGFVSHMTLAIRVKNAAIARKLTALLIAAKEKQAMPLGLGLVSLQGTVSPGAVQQQVLHANPGVYVLVCFMDTQDGREHIRLGMERTIRVTK